MTDSKARFLLGGDRDVARLGFGAMRLTGEGGWGDHGDKAAMVRLLRRAADIGVELFDTSDSYGPHVSEQLIAEALHPYPRLTIATKGGLTRSGPHQFAPVGRPEYLRQCVLMSLRRLRVDRIDLWYLHRIDPKVPETEQFEAIAEFQKEGLVAHLGLSAVDRKQAERACGFFKVAAIQNRYSLADRSAEPLLRYCEATGTAFVPFFPGELGQAQDVADEIARAHNASARQVALAWLLHRSPSILPIPGTANIAHLEENVAAADLTLSADEVQALVTASEQRG
ncbi:MAG: aldo/keto reductase [Burkholderiaceae bacterium]